MSIFRGNGGSGASEATSVIIPVSQGGTGATTIAEARLNINAAKNGVNSDITQLLGLEQPLSVAQGGTGARDATTARTNLGAASSAQGALADTALQTEDVATVALTGSYNDLLDIPTAGTGDVVGPASSTDGAVALFDGTTGLLLKDGVVLGTAATTDSTDYATAAQGAKADSAVQPADLATVATTGAYSDLSGKPTLGTASAQDVEYFAIAASSNSFTQNQVISVTDNTNAALRITQLGTGNALLVEDSSNPDSTPFVIDASGIVIHGSTASVPVSGNTEYEQLHGTSGGASSRSGTAWSAASAATAPSYTFARSRGSSVGDYTIVQSGDSIGSIVFRAADGTKMVSSASVSAQVDGTPGTNDMPCRLTFSTTADGASTLTERMRITSAGNVGIGSTSPSTKLEVNGTVTATSFIGDGSQLTGVNGGQYFGTAATKAIAYNSQTISENITVTSGNSGLSAGPITISSGYAVTIASDSRWVIV